MTNLYLKLLVTNGDRTLTRYDDNSLYISGCKSHLMSRFYGSWVKLKVHFVIITNIKNQSRNYKFLLMIATILNTK